jgi:hypothetical protein
VTGDDADAAVWVPLDAAEAMLDWDEALRVIRLGVAEGPMA